MTIDHTYETAVEFPDGLVAPAVPFDGPDQVALLEKIARVRTDDARFVVDRLPTRAGAGLGAAQPPAEPGVAVAVGGTPAARYDVGVPAGRHHVFTDLVPILTRAAQLGVPAATVEKRIGTLADPPRTASDLTVVG